MFNVFNDAMYNLKDSVSVCVYCIKKNIQSIYYTHLNMYESTYSIVNTRAYIILLYVPVLIMLETKQVFFFCLSVYLTVRDILMCDNTIFDNDDEFDSLTSY
jgi:hypothetical protein